MKNLQLTFFLILFTSLCQAQQIDSIRFEGLTRTKEVYLRKIILCEEGMEYDEAMMQGDVELLRNLNLFFNVEARKEESTTGTNVVFTILEAKYVYPVIWMSGFQDQLKLVLGVNHLNFLGRAQSIGGTYQYYDRHSIYVFWKANRHGNSLTGHEVAFQKYSTVEPLYFDDTVSFFNFDNYSALLGGHIWLTRYLKAGVGGKYMYEEYEQRDDAFPLGNKGFAFHKYQVHGGVDYDRIEHIYEKQDGLRAGLYGEYIHTQDFPEATFLKVLAKVVWYKKINERGNLALRGKFGLATNNFSPFSPFVLDGILNVRGIGNRVERGTGELILNAEYRCTFVNHKYFSIQGALFTDYGALRSPGERLDSFFNRDPNVFTGGGVRFNLNVWYKTSLRVDYSVNPFDGRHGLTFGFGQFF